MIVERLCGIGHGITALDRVTLPPVILGLNNKHEVAVQTVESREFSVTRDPEIDVPYLGRHLSDVAVRMQEAGVPDIWVLVSRSRVVVDEYFAEFRSNSLRMVY